jgi:SPP1 gp7 family putative phage head morphogenesis protein
VPSKIERIVAKHRKQLEQREAPVRQSLAVAYDRAARSLQADLDRITLQIKQARAAGEDVNPDWLNRQSSYQRLLDQAKREFDRFSDDAQRILKDAQLQSVTGGAHEAWELMEQTGVTSGFDANINRGATERAVAALQDDSPLREVLDRYGERAATLIEEHLTNGIIKGTGPREIVRQLMRELNGGYTKARLNALVRNEMLRAYRGSLAESFKPFEHRARGYRRTAAHGIRTCLACLALDGQITQKVPARFHVACRCSFHLVPLDSTYEYEKGVDWLRRQPESVQRRMFPTADAYLAFRDNKVKLSDFAGVNQSKTWGSSVTERSWKDVASRKGLPYRTNAGRDFVPARPRGDRDEPFQTFTTG